MRRFTATLLASTLGTLSALATPMPDKTVPMRTFNEARALPAWTVFCEGPGKVECALDTAQPDRIVLTPSIWKEILAVNAHVNASVEPVRDQEHWDAPDVWGLAEDGRGDSEDYALLKRRLLVGKGLPRRAMRITVVIDEKGEGHPVLTLLTDRGDYPLDSKTGAVLPWDRTGYTFIKRESQDKLGWVSLGGVTSPSDYDKKPASKDAVTPAPRP